MSGAHSAFKQEFARGLTVEEAATYAGCKTVSAFRDWIRRGLMPGPLPGTHRYDRKAIDAALDRMSGLAPTMQESSYASWKRSRADQA